MVHTGAARPYSACRSGSGLNEGLGLTAPTPRLNRWIDWRNHGRLSQCRTFQLRDDEDAPNTNDERQEADGQENCNCPIADLGGEKISVDNEEHGSYAAERHKLGKIQVSMSSV